MTQKVWTFGDIYRRADWGPGPWDNEPDKVEWRDRESGLPCIARRGPMGAWCGYVAVPPDHPWWGNGEAPVECHGGQTFGSMCDPSESDEAICHVPAPGEPADVWWIGFDCGHYRDRQPGLDALFRKRGDEDDVSDRLAGGRGQAVYRDLAYVFEECRRLARQCVAVTLPGPDPARWHRLANLPTQRTTGGPE